MSIVLSEALMKTLVTEVECVKVVPEKAKGITSGALYRIKGNTFPVKDYLKKVGCRWNSDEKCWVTKNAYWREQALEQASGDDKAVGRLSKLKVECDGSSLVGVIPASLFGGHNVATAFKGGT